MDTWRRWADLSNPRDIIVLKMCASTGKTLVASSCSVYSMGVLKEPERGVKGMVFSITEDNLKDNFWPEISNVLGRTILMKSYLERDGKKLKPKRKEDDDDNWRVSARTIPKSSDMKLVGDTIRGIHAPYCFVIGDEGEGITARAGRKMLNIFTARNLIWGRVMVMGNPTHKKSCLYDMYTNKMSWVADIHGDPRREGCSKRIDREFNLKMIETYHDDDPDVMSSIMGEWHEQDVTYLLSDEEVQRCMDLDLQPHEYANADIRMGVDVARGKEKGDKSVIVIRQGRKVLHYEAHKNMEEPQLAGRVAELKYEYNTWREFIDCTGGYGDTCLNFLKLTLGVTSAIPVVYSAKADNPRGYINKRAEMWWRVRMAVRGISGLGCLDLPNEPELKQDLTIMRYSYVGDSKIKMFEKKLLKKENEGRSPDGGDALANTYYMVDRRDTSQDNKDTRRMRNSNQSKYFKSHRSGSVLERPAFRRRVS